MNRSILLLSISTLWLLTEVLIGRLTHVKSSSGNERDQKSLRVLWLTIIPSVVLGVVVGIWGIGYVTWFAPIAFPLGLTFISVGLLLRWWAVYTLRKFFTANVAILPDHQLITFGIYSVLRHPAYTGSLLSFLGLGVVFSNWLSMTIIFIPIFLAFRYRIQVEEAVLQETFGAAYEAYARKTKRLLPGVY